jgi:hypothetical protein
MNLSHRLQFCEFIEGEHNRLLHTRIGAAIARQVGTFVYSNRAGEVMREIRDVGRDGGRAAVQRYGALPEREGAFLSDGERGMLVLVLDLTRRLAQANPSVADPAGETGAVVLIDEIDLHLHPKWQRQIVNNLRSAFPRCQFIATTHSAKSSTIGFRSSRMAKSTRRRIRMA